MTDQDLTPLLLDALGKRIDDPAAIRLTMATGKKPFKSATPNNSTTRNAVCTSQRYEVEAGALLLCN